MILGPALQIGLRAPYPSTVVAVAPTVHRLGDAFLREYLLPFEVASVVLLMALVGAMVIARRAVKEEAGADPANPEAGRSEGLGLRDQPLESPATADAAGKEG